MLKLVSQKKATSKLNEDLGNMNWESFRKIFKETVKNAISKLKVKGHLIVFIKDLQPKNGQRLPILRIFMGPERVRN